MKLNVKGLIEIGLFSILTFALIYISGFIGYIPAMMPFVPFFCGLISGPINFLYGNRINKFGMFFIHQLLISIGFSITGHYVFSLIGGLLSGVIGEFLLKENYNNEENLTLAFYGMSLIFMGNLLPIYLNRSDYMKILISQGYSIEFIKDLSKFLPDWSMLPVFLTGMIGIYLGLNLGKKILKKFSIKRIVVGNI